jgi:uncharacterized protein YdeI (BOF family)
MMNRIEAAFYLFQDSSNRVVEKESGRIWMGLHLSPVTNLTVLPNYVIEQLPDVEFTLHTWEIVND